MRRIKEALRLHLQAGLSYDEIGRALKISKSSASKYVSLARAAGVDCELAQTLSDDELEARLFRPPVPRSSHQLAPDFALVHQELKRAGVTLQLLWEEYARDNALAYKYTSFCIKYRAFAQSLKRSMRQVHIADEKLFVDCIVPPVSGTYEGGEEVLGGEGSAVVPVDHGQTPARPPLLNTCPSDVFDRQSLRMTGNEFIRKVRALGKQRGMMVVLNASRGNGSHQTLYFGSAFTVVRNSKDELKTGTLHGMCTQIGIKVLDL